MFSRADRFCGWHNPIHKVFTNWQLVVSIIRNVFVAQTNSLLPTLPIRALYDNIFELNGHREVRVKLKSDGSGPGGGGISVVGGLCASEPWCFT